MSCSACGLGPDAHDGSGLCSGAHHTACVECGDPLPHDWPHNQRHCGDCLDPDLFCAKHGLELPMGPYGVRYGGCEECEPPESEGEAFRGGEAAAYQAEQQHAAQRLKR